MLWGHPSPVPGHLLAVRFWGSCSMFGSFHFLICELGRGTVPSPRGCLELPLTPAAGPAVWQSGDLLAEQLT